VVLSLLTIGLTLIGGSAPEALSELLAETAGDYFFAKAGVRLVRGDVVDAGVVVLVVVCSYALYLVPQCRRFAVHPE
jgi:hypothetical protein